LILNLNSPRRAKGDKQRQKQRIYYKIFKSAACSKPLVDK